MWRNLLCFFKTRSGVCRKGCDCGNVVPFWNWRKSVPRPADEMQLGSNVGIASQRRISLGSTHSGLWWAWVDLNHRPRPYQRSEVRSYNNLQDRTNCRLGCGLGFSFEWARSPQTYSIEPFRTFQPCLSHSRSQHQLAAGMSQFELSECFAHVVEGEDSGNRHF